MTSGSPFRGQRKEVEVPPEGNDPSFLSMEFDIKREMVGAVIGKGGGTARGIRTRTGASVHVNSPATNENSRVFVALRGRREQIESAFEELRQVVATVDQEYANQMQASLTLKTKPETIGCLIGKQGQNIRLIEEETRARVRVEPHEEGEEYQCVHVSGEVSAVYLATRMVQDSLDRYDSTRSNKPQYVQRYLAPQVEPVPAPALKPEIPQVKAEHQPAPILIQAPPGGFTPQPQILVLHNDGTYHPAQIVVPLDNGLAAAGLVTIALPQAAAISTYLPQSQTITAQPQQSTFQQYQPQFYNLQTMEQQASNSMVIPVSIDPPQNMNHQ